LALRLLADAEVDRPWAIAVSVSSDGKHVYVAGADDNAVAVFSRDASTGKLMVVEVEKDGVGGVDGLGGARSVTVSPDGKHVYAAGADDDAVAVFAVPSAKMAPSLSLAVLT
jgi:6-phosphogluconolactonase (cycloisomerase 2 family)